MTQSTIDPQVHDLSGVGIGPFNLSLAALLSPIKKLSYCFFDRTPSFTWHPGMLLSTSELQVNFLNDLVTLVDPTNPYSFITYLAKHKRLYRFINAQFKYIFRLEYSQYLNWVSRSLPNMYFNEEVLNIGFDSSHFVLQTTKRVMKSKHLVLGNGLTPKIPVFAKPYIGHTVFHNSEFLKKSLQLHGKKVAVIGGGQSGAEIIHTILNDNKQLPEQLTWISKRNQLLSLDNSPFVSEFFTPSYAEYFYHLPSDKKSQLLNEQHMASDGISLHLIESIYQQLYRIELLENKDDFFKFYPRSQLVNMEKRHSKKYTLVIEDLELQQTGTIQADIVIFCTGYEWTFPEYLSQLADRTPLINNRFCINQDFSILWDGPKQNRIYIQNGARHSHGIADPNLNIMAWRSATIINSISPQQIYDLSPENTAISWEPPKFLQHQELPYASIA